ncbi:membrane transport protein-domain-containing protein [Irpex rosettiformis]|uniref:Membrane transport protein-domain-containing protein n=1 Tax=Irpex rosettiformis TaxID=378272 RepID=A0ACB8U8R2_9APHY|nr:membrane transport protein-domain-containing protein [Irpex rosettiformis]
MSSSDTPIGPLLRTVFESILEVFVLCLAGYVLARKGVLDRKTQKQINRLNVSLFTPSLLFSKVAFFLSPAKLRELWIIPIFFVITTAVSMTVAFVLGWIFRLKRSQRSFAVAAAMFMNSNSLPIALMQSLVVTVPSLKWGEDDNNNAMVGRALTYLVLYSTLGMILRWSYGVRLLSQADPEPQVGEIHLPMEEPLLDGQEPVFAPSQVLHRNTSGESATAASGNPSIAVGDADSSKDVDPKFFYSFPNTPMRRSTHLPSSDVHSVHTSEDGEDDEDDVIEFPARRHVTEPTSSIWHSRRRRLRRKVGKVFRNFYEFMTVPLWAALLSLIVACIPPLQHTLDNHVQPIKGALTQAGNCSIPLTLVVLGAYFYTPPDPEPERARASLPSHSGHVSHAQRNRGRSASTAWSHSSLIDNVRDMLKLKRRSSSQESLVKKEKEKRPGETKTVVIAILSRMVITPLLLLPLMAVSTRFDWQEVFEDPVFVVSNVLLIASPPALTLAQITQAASGDAFERLISRTVFWSYCVFTPPSTILVVVVGLLLSKL